MARPQSTCAKISEVWPCGFLDIPCSGQTNKQTNMHTRPLIYGD